MLQIAEKEAPVLATSHEDTASVEKVLEAIDKFFQKEKKLISERRDMGRRETVVEWLNAMVSEEANRWIEPKIKVQSNPYDVILEFQKKYPPGSLFSK